MAKFQVSVTVDQPSDMEYAIAKMRAKFGSMIVVIENIISVIVERAKPLLQVLAEMKDDLFGLHPRLTPAVRLVE